MDRFPETRALVLPLSSYKFISPARFFAALLLVAVYAGTPIHGQMVADGIAAVVNDQVIDYLEINGYVADTEQLLRQNFSGQELYNRLKEARLNVLRSLIERQLIIQDFKTSGGFIPDNFVDDRIRDIVRTQYNGDRSVFIKTLFERGISMEKYRQDIKDNAVVGYMRNKNVAQTIIVSPYQVEKYYEDNIQLFAQDEQIKVSTIILRKSPSATGDDPQLALAHDIEQKLNLGQDFGDLAKQYSEGSNKDQGGLLGWVTQKGRLSIRADLWPAIANLQPGQHTDVIATDDGYYYLLLVNDRRKSFVQPIASVRKQIEDTIINEESQRRQQEWMDSLRAKAFIKMMF